MRILVTCKKRGWSGETAAILDLMKGCVAAGHTVLLGARVDSEIRKRASGVEHVPLELLHEPTAVRALLKDLRTLRRVLAEVDLVHCSASWDSWLVGIARRTLAVRPPMIRARHNLKEIRSHPQNRWLYGAQVDAWIAQSATIRAHLESHDFIRAPIHTIYYGIDTDHFDPKRVDRDAARRELREAVGAAPDAPVVVYVSRVAPRKQPEVFVEAAALLRSRFPAARFLLVGAFDTSDFGKRLRKRAEELEPAVQTIGFAEDVPKLLAGADAFVLPSPAEPFGLAPVEAMAMGCPPVCANAAGLAESVIHDRTGLLFPPGNAQACAEAIAALLEDPLLHARLAEAGRPHVLEHFSIERTVAEHLELFNELATKAHARLGR